MRSEWKIRAIKYIKDNNKIEINQIIQYSHVALASTTVFIRQRDDFVIIIDLSLNFQNFSLSRIFS
jgi:hypothetical protein